MKGFVVPGKVTNINLGVSVIKSEDNVRNLFRDSRKCRFGNEPEEESFYEVSYHHLKKK